MRVKICGITSATDALAAAAAGADAIGLNFVSGPRQVNPSRATDILQALPPMITPVALVKLDAGGIPPALVKWLISAKVSHLQLYGEVTIESLKELWKDGFNLMPVLAVRDEDFTGGTDNKIIEYLTLKKREPVISAIVLDTFDPVRRGGTGMTFPWTWVSSARAAGRLAGWPPIILAGGLNPDNVAEAVRIVQPYAVDVSSGIEVEGVPGKKDAEKMQAFVRNAKRNE